MKKKLLCAVLALSLLLPVVAVSPSASGEETDGKSYRWPAGQAMPTFAPMAETLDAIDVRSLPFAERLAVACLQGIVNRTQPRVFLVDRDTDSRDAWGADLGISSAPLPGWKDAVTKYRTELKGLVVFNPAVQASANVATTVAGLTDTLAVSPDLAAVLSAAPYNLPVLTDLRTAPITDHLSAYRWLYENYWAQCTRRTICGLAPDGHFPLRDFAVAVGAAVIWLDAKIPEERAVLKLFFEGTQPLDCFYTGWWPNEPAGISFASAFGVMTIASDFYLNYSVYSAMPRELDIPAIPAKPVLEDGKIYVSLNISDGDNIQYDQGAMRVARLWGSADRGKVPIGWTFSPVMLDAGPQILNWYYKTATQNDVLICGPSGVGYSTAAQWPGKAFAQRYGAMTNAYFERTGINIITVWNKLTGSRAEWFASRMPSLLGLTTQFDSGPKIRFTGNNTPVVWFGSDVRNSRGAMSYDSGTDNMKLRLSAAAERDCEDAQFFACQVDVWHTSVSDLVRLTDELDAAYPGRFVFVRPDHFMMLCGEYYGKPYLASLQKTASASRDNGGGPAAITDGTFSTGWQAPAPGEAALQIDLGESVVLDRYVLKNAETNDMGASLNTRAWELQASTDGARWTSVDSVSDNGEAIVYRALRARTGRYIRLVIKDPGSDDIARVQELEIYGVAEARADDSRVTLRRIWKDFVTCLANPVFEIIVWVESLFAG